jgi:oxaloacetate decarboxylase gamma subunit
MDELIGQGLVLMVVGMGVVFAFLALLVGAMNGSASFFQKFAHLFPEETLPKSGTRKPAQDFSEIAVAIAAVKAHTQK